MNQQGSNSNMKLFKDPFSLMKETKGRGVMGFKSNDNILVLGDENTESLDFFLANNPKVKSIELFGFHSKDLSLSKRKELQKNGIKFTFMESNGKSKERDKGLNISR